MGISVRYDLVGAGWSRCTVEVGEKAAEITASYLSDALDDLATFVIAMLEGHPSPRCSFTEEPGEYRWKAERISDDRIRLQILGFKQIWGNRPDAEGESILDVECRVRTFAGAVLSELQRLERDVGPAEYAEKWHTHPFPAHRIAQIKALLAR